MIKCSGCVVVDPRLIEGPRLGVVTEFSSGFYWRARSLVHGHVLAGWAGWGRLARGALNAEVSVWNLEKRCDGLVQICAPTQGGLTDPGVSISRALDKEPRQSHWDFISWNASHYSCTGNLYYCWHCAFLLTECI